MRVISEGEVTTRVEDCLSCGSTLEYTNADVRYISPGRMCSQRHFVECPVCGECLDVKRVYVRGRFELE